MARFFIEVFYKGTNYAGFQIQQNANSIQAEIEKALKIFYKDHFGLTGSSRTDAGVHAMSNYFHFDSELLSVYDQEAINKGVYNLNSILPMDIVIRQIYKVADDAHCRFDAISREYQYNIFPGKNPFLSDRAYYYPYQLDMESLQQAAVAILNYKDFTSFSKRNTQSKTFDCEIFESCWMIKENLFIYKVRANRFLRGMVKGLVGTMLKVGTGKISLNEFHEVIEQKNCSLADFSVPAHGLFLMNVQF